MAPEHRFPIGLEDCYAAARTLYMDLLREDQDKITIMGDSAGGNLAAAVCLLARDRGEFMQMCIRDSSYTGGYGTGSGTEPYCSLFLQTA